MRKWESIECSHIKKCKQQCRGAYAYLFTPLVIEADILYSLWTHFNQMQAPICKHCLRLVVDADWLTRYAFVYVFKSHVHAARNSRPTLYRQNGASPIYRANKFKGLITYVSTMLYVWKILYPLWCSTAYSAIGFLQSMPFQPNMKSPVI